MTARADPLVTVVIPARDEQDAIEPCLRSVLAQSESRLQVIVVDGASRDRTAHIVSGFAERDRRVELLHNPEGVIPVSLNLALAAARGRWLVRVDAHAEIPPDYVARIVRHFRTGDWGGVGGRKDGVGRTPAGRAVAAVLGSRFGVGNSPYHYGTRIRTVPHIPFGAYPVALARELGGWDPRLRVHQDFEFDHRVRASGRELLFDPAVAIRWGSRQSARELFAQYRRYGRGKARVAELHPGAVGVRHLAVAGFVAAAVVSLVVAPWLPWAAAVVLAPYLVAVAAVSIAVARHLPRRARPWVPVCFLALHAGWGLGFLAGLPHLAWVLSRRAIRGAPVRAGPAVQRGAS